MALITQQNTGHFPAASPLGTVISLLLCGERSA